MFVLSIGYYNKLMLDALFSKIPNIKISLVSSNLVHFCLKKFILFKGKWLSRIDSLPSLNTFHACHDANYIGRQLCNAGKVTAGKIFEVYQITE